MQYAVYAKEGEKERDGSRVSRYARPGSLWYIIN
jgi:hypothetical protein